MIIVNAPQATRDCWFAKLVARFASFAWLPCVSQPNASQVSPQTVTSFEGVFSSTLLVSQGSRAFCPFPVSRGQGPRCAHSFRPEMRQFVSQKCFAEVASRFVSHAVNSHRTALRIARNGPLRFNGLLV